MCVVWGVLRLKPRKLFYPSLERLCCWPENGLSLVLEIVGAQKSVLCDDKIINVFCVTVYSVSVDATCRWYLQAPLFIPLRNTTPNRPLSHLNFMYRAWSCQYLLTFSCISTLRHKVCVVLPSMYISSLGWSHMTRCETSFTFLCAQLFWILFLANLFLFLLLFRAFYFGAFFFIEAICLFSVSSTRIFVSHKSYHMSSDETQ